jgi:hypothetical protein
MVPLNVSRVIRCLRILAISVVRGTPRCAAAPPMPPITQLVLPAGIRY